MSRPVDTVIDADLCTGCGECVRVCPSQTLSLVDGVAVVSGATSLGCGHCVAVCPEDAVTVGFVDSDAMEVGSIGAADDVVEPGGFDVASLVRLMRSRRSCRSYRERPVERAVLDDLVRIGITAPSGTNSQRWTFTILPDRASVLHLGELVRGFFERLNRRAANPVLRLVARVVAKDALGTYHREHFDRVEEGLRQWKEEGRDRLFHGAPAAILVGSAPGASCPVEDALLASQNILLAAHAMGLGTCLVGFVVEAMRHDPGIARAIGIPAEEEVHAVIAVGYPDVEYLRPTGRRRVVPRYFTGS